MEKSIKNININLNNIDNKITKLFELQYGMIKVLNNEFLKNTEDISKIHDEIAQSIIFSYALKIAHPTSDQSKSEFKTQGGEANLDSDSTSRLASEPLDSDIREGRAFSISKVPLSQRKKNKEYGN